MLTHQEIDELVRRIVARMQPQAVILFGSYAKGTATTASDLDLFVIADTELPFARRADDLKPLFSREWLRVDVHVYTPEEVRELGKEPHSFVKSVLGSGMPLYERAGGHRLPGREGDDGVSRDAA
jgi:predicted nucleotidyltransferase